MLDHHFWILYKNRGKGMNANLLKPHLSFFSQLHKKSETPFFAPKAWEKKSFKRKVLTTPFFCSLRISGHVLTMEIYFFSSCWYFAVLPFLQSNYAIVHKNSKDKALKAIPGLLLPFLINKTTPRITKKGRRKIEYESVCFSWRGRFSYYSSNQ